MEQEKKLHILWTNADINTSLHMVMMYATNCMLRGWWDAVTVIVWGAPAKLVAENEDVQKRIGMAIHAGVKFSACIGCSRQLGVVEQLDALGIPSVSWGPALTSLIQEKQPLITI